MTDGEKKAFRARVRAMMAELDEDYLSESDAGILDAVLALGEYRGAERVLTYCSEGREVSTRGIIADALREGKTVALPVVYSGGRMVFAELRGELGVGALGIHEPRGELAIVSPTERDVMIIPALCCDAEGFRLGRGGGYYDRYLAGCPAFTVCLCRERLLAERVPREWNDLPVLSVITEKRVLRP